LASLRKKPDVATVADSPEVAVSVEANTSPTPPVEKPVTHSEAETALLRQLRALRESEGYQQRQTAIASAEQRRREWLAGNPLAQKNIEALDGLHSEALQSGLVDTSPQYFDYLSERLVSMPAQQTVDPRLIDDMRERVARDRATPEPPPRSASSNGAMVSAPVSREVAASDGKRQSGKMTLTREEVDAARVSGITVEEYAKNKQKYQQMRETGEYRDQR
jgi:hypothetical protein